MKMKMNKSLTAGGLLIGVGLSAAAFYAVAPAIKNLANNMSNNNAMSNNNTNNSTSNENPMYWK